ncbi:unnamed protein product [Schistocephalus solidus]|uniref:Uncharacterized protein n=1 Tax=Schistocephalus solidus TaxID=70667 RepID=A0A183TKW6_SCHSO|nr:unnamed protein product [Schistocephalus solidus]
MGEEQVAGTAGTASKRAATPGSDPTEQDCHRGHIMKEPLQTGSQPIAFNQRLHAWTLYWSPLLIMERAHHCSHHVG